MSATSVHHTIVIMAERLARLRLPRWVRTMLHRLALHHLRALVELCRKRQGRTP